MSDSQVTHRSVIAYIDRTLLYLAKRRRGDVDFRMKFHRVRVDGVLPTSTSSTAVFRFDVPCSPASADMLRRSA